LINITLSCTKIFPLLVVISLALYSQQAPLKVEIAHDLDENSAQVFDVEVRVSDFTDLYSFQLFMKWDSTVYRVDGVPYINTELPAFTTQNIVLPSNDQVLPSKGKLRIIWSDARTLSLPDDTHIATIRFTAIGEECEESIFAFDDIGQQESQQLLATDRNFENIGIESESMMITIPGVNCLSSTTIVEDFGINVYPNPVRDILNVDHNGKLPAGSQLSIYGANGQVIKTVTLTSTQNSINVSELQEGSYLYKLSKDNQISAQGRFIRVQ